MKFVFEIRFGRGQTEEKFLEQWRKGSTEIQKLPGARGTVIYRKIEEPGVLLAIATWESEELRDAALDRLSERGEEGLEILHRHAELGQINVIGTFEEIDHVSPP